MRLDIIMLEREIEHAKKGDVESADKVLKMLENYISADKSIPDVLSAYIAEVARKIDNGETREKAFNLSRRPGNQYSKDTILKEINIARFVHNLQNYLKNHSTLEIDYLTLYVRPSEVAIKHLNENFIPAIESICDWLEAHELVPHITSRSAKNSKNRNFMKADNIRKIHDRWIDGIRATEEHQ